jgi:hypothetical protein
LTCGGILLTLIAMPSLSALASARRNLADRIERFLRDQIAHPTPDLTGWQTDGVLAAIEALSAEEFEDGEYAMLKAEKADMFEPPDYVPAVRRDARRQLLDRLQRVVAA